MMSARSVAEELPEGERFFVVRNAMLLDQRDEIAGVYRASADFAKCSFAEMKFRLAVNVGEITASRRR